MAPIQVWQARIDVVATTYKRAKRQQYVGGASASAASSTSDIDSILPAMHDQPSIDMPAPAIKWEPIILGIGLVLPSIVTWAYFFEAESAPPVIQWVVFPAAKAIQFSLPVVWKGLILRGQVRLRPRSSAGIGFGLAFGALVAAAAFAVYFGVLNDSAAFERAAEPIRRKIAGFKIDSVSKYALLGLFYSLCHSLLEEYYWRWFVFGRLRLHVDLIAAVAISSVAFMAHHVLVLSKFFGPTHWATWLFSFSVAVGGAVWAWLYDRSRSLVGPWLSHMLVDAAIFTIGYDLVRSLLTS